MTQQWGDRVAARDLVHGGRGLVRAVLKAAAAAAATTPAPLELSGRVAATRIAASGLPEMAATSSAAVVVIAPAAPVASVAEMAVPATAISSA